MRLPDDERGQAIQVGAVLLFAVLIIAFSTYQAVIIPADNRRVEFNHNQEVQDNLADLRNAVLATSEATSPRSVSIALGTQYPSRTLGLNPSPPSGSLRTVGTTDPAVNLTIENATVDGETGDLWNGSALVYNTGGLRYGPNYHRYEEAPETVYEHSVLYNRFSETTSLVLANQTLVDGNRVSLVTLNGSLDRSASSSTTVDVRPISSSTETVLVEAESGNSPITLTFTSTLSADNWSRILSDEENVVDVTGSPSPAGSDFTDIRVELDNDTEYRLQMTKAAVGQGATAEGAAYLTDVAGDGASIQRGTSQQLTLAVRDRFNNPVAGVTVNASIGGSSPGTLDSSTKTTGSDGRVTFTYSTSASTPTGDHAINFSTEAPSVFTTSFDDGTTANVSTTVTVTAPASGGGSGSGAYTVDWADPNDGANGNDVFDGCDNETCTWDIGKSGNSALDLNATLGPVFEGIDLEFAVSNSTVGTVSPASGTTGANGAATTTLTASANGTVDVLASGNEGSDTITIEVENVSGGGGGGQGRSIRARLDHLTLKDTDDPAFIASYDVADANGSFERVDITYTSNSGEDGSVSDSGTRAGIRFEPGYGQSADFDVTYEVIYTDANGDEYVAASTTISDTADAVNPGGNADLSTASSAQLTSWEIVDDSQTNGNLRARYEFTYAVTGSGSFSEVRAHALNLDSGPSGVSTFGDRSQNNQQIQLSSGLNDEYRVGLVVRDADGVVVDIATVNDNADASGTYTGP